MESYSESIRGNNERELRAEEKLHEGKLTRKIDEICRRPCRSDDNALGVSCFVVSFLFRRGRHDNPIFGWFVQITVVMIAVEACVLPPPRSQNGSLFRKRVPLEKSAAEIFSIKRSRSAARLHIVSEISHVGGHALTRTRVHNMR